MYIPPINDQLIEKEDGIIHLKIRYIRLCISVCVYVFYLVVCMNISLYVYFFCVSDRGKNDTGTTRKTAEKKISRH